MQRNNYFTINNNTGYHMQTYISLLITPPIIKPAELVETNFQFKSDGPGFCIELVNFKRTTESTEILHRMKNFFLPCLAFYFGVNSGIMFTCSQECDHV